MKKYSLSLLLSICSGFSLAQSDQDATPCVETIKVDSFINRLTLPIAPLRTLNLMFPVSYNSESFTASLSSSEMFSIKEPNDSKLAIISYKAWSKAFHNGVRDLTIMTKEGLYFTIALKASAYDYCGTIIFEYSDALMAQIKENDSKKRRLDEDNYRKEILDTITTEVDKKIITKLGAIIASKPHKIKIYETTDVRTKDGIPLEITLEVIEQYDGYSIMKGYILNDGSKTVSISSLQMTDSHGLPINGVADGNFTIKSGKENVFTFATLSNFPERNGTAILMINDDDKIEVKW